MPGKQTEVVLSPRGSRECRAARPPCSPSARHWPQPAEWSCLPALAWREVPGFLSGAAVTIVPSARETFGNLALESLSVGTPVVAHATGNLPDLIGPDAGILVPPEAGPGGLLEVARELLADAVRYHRACGAAYCRSRNYRSADVAEAFLKAVL